MHNLLLVGFKFGYNFIFNYEPNIYVKIDSYADPHYIWLWRE